MSEVADLKQQEESQTVTLEHAGMTFTIEKVEDPSVELLEALEANKIVTAIRLLMGEEQYLKFKSTKPKLSDLQKVLSHATGSETGK